MLLVADVVGRRRRRMTAEEEALFGIDKLNTVRSEIPAVTHVDYSARVQTVHRDTNPRYWGLLQAFRQRTGCPVLVNTSFNVRGEPIVCDAERRLPLLHGDRDRGAGGGQLLPAQGGPGPVAQARLQGRVRARLRRGGRNACRAARTIRKGGTDPWFAPGGGPAMLTLPIARL